MSSLILAVDLGSTHIKAALFDAVLNELATGASPTPCRFGEGGCAEIPVDAFRRAVQEAMAPCLAATAGLPLRAIALTSQAQTFTILNGAGHALIPFISWQDGRGGASAEALSHDPVLAAFGSHSSFGCVLPALQLTQLHRLCTAQPALLCAPHRIVALPTFLIGQWTGREVVDDNLAAMSGLYSLMLRTWWPPAMQAAGLDSSQLPAIVTIGAAAGITTNRAAAFGLPAGVPVIPAGNDQTAGAYGARLDEADSLLITLGTAQVAYAISRALPGPTPGLIRGPFPGGHHYAMAADAYGGNLVNWARTVIAGCETSAAFDSVAGTAPPGCHGVVFEIAADGAGGVWRNLGLHHGPGDLARAVLEALGRRLAGMVRTLCPSGPLPAVKLAGGGAKSALWRAIVAEALGAPVATTSAAPLLGAARLARRATPCRQREYDTTPAGRLDTCIPGVSQTDGKHGNAI